MSMKPLPFGTFIHEGLATQMAKYWVNPTSYSMIEFSPHNDHLPWAIMNLDQIKVNDSSKEKILYYKKERKNDWKYTSWEDIFEEFFMNGWVRMVGHIDMKLSKGDDEVLTRIELHGYKSNVNKLGKLLENEFPNTSEFIQSIIIESQFTDCKSETVTNPLRLRRFFKGGKIQ